MLALFFCVVAVNAAPAVSSKKAFLEPNDVFDVNKATEEAKAVVAALSGEKKGTDQMIMEAMKAQKKTAEEQFAQKIKALNEAKVADKKSSEMVGAAKVAADTAKTEFSGVLRKLASAAGAAANKAAIEKAERAVMEKTAAEKAAKKTEALNDVKADMKKMIAKAEAAKFEAEKATAELAAAAEAKANSAETAAEKAHAAEVAKAKAADVAKAKAAEYKADVATALSENVATALSENKPPKLQKAENSAQAAEYAAKYRADGGNTKARDGWFAPGIPSLAAAKAGQLHDGDKGSAKATQSNMAEASAKGEDGSEEKIAEFAADGKATAGLVKKSEEDFLKKMGTEDAAESDKAESDEDFLKRLSGDDDSVDDSVDRRIKANLLRDKKFVSDDDSVDAADDGEEMTRTMPLGGDQAPEEMDAGDDSDDAADDGKDYDDKVIDDYDGRNLNDEQYLKKLGGDKVDVSMAQISPSDDNDDDSSWLTEENRTDENDDNTSWLTDENDDRDGDWRYGPAAPEGGAVSMAQLSSSDPVMADAEIMLAEIQHGTGDKFQKGCVSFSIGLVAHKGGDKKKVDSQMALICSAMKFAVDVDMCGRYRSTLMGHLHKKAAWNMKSMDYSLFCKGMIKVKAEQTKSLKEAVVEAKKLAAALKAAAFGIAMGPAPAPAASPASSLKEETSSLKAWEQKWGMKAKL